MKLPFMKAVRGRRRLFWQIFSSFLAISLGLLIVVTVFASSTLERFFLMQCHQELETGVKLAAIPIMAAMEAKNEAAVNTLCHELHKSTDMRFTVVRHDGKAIGDSDFQISAMANHLDRPEIVEAIAEGKGSSIRFSDTVNQQLIYVAHALTPANGPRFFLRAARGMNEVEAALLGLKLKIFLAWSIGSVLAAILFRSFSQRISRPFEALKDKALKLVLETDQGRNLPENEHLDEAGGVSEAIQLLVNDLKDRASTISQQREELEAILSSMSEALLAVDSNGSVLKINRTMADYFGLDAQTCRGRKLQALIRNVELNAFVEEALQSSEPVSATLVFYGPEQHILRGSGTRIRNAEGRVFGAVIVLNDITRLKRLEDLRKDFVANVSHELRTPITSIKGFVETLESGALDEPESARRFLSIISRQTNRLSSIIEDLLSLSKIEQQHDRLQLDLEPCSLRKTLRSALRQCEDAAKKKEITLDLQCPESYEVRIHQSLFEQAVVNLVDNAIKYSEGQRTVTVIAVASENLYRIQVIDQGFGIPRIHLPRLFERFYRVDKARSRDIGGTGLGLSIVKHIAVAHGGNVEVTSEVGKGSTFTLTLPVS